MWRSFLARVLIWFVALAGLGLYASAQTSTGTQRNFTLVEMPTIPEPTSVGLALLGMLLLFRKKRI